jgi:4-hydroxy-2-oxoheptanedioate aldolase
METLMPALRDTLRNNVKEKLARDEVVASMTVRLCRSIEIAQIAKTAGFDTLYVDLEHNMFSFDSTGQICMAALQAGIAPFVRVPSISPEFISRVLDGGALGVIAPHVSTVEEARQVVRYAKFPPIGERSYGGPLASTGFRTFPVAEANAALNDATMVICMVETVQAVENVDAIAAVEGVDMLFIGTNDLCGSIGIPGQYGDARVRDAYARTIQACRSRGKHVGIGGIGSRPDLIAEFVKAGARYISIGSDLGFMIDACNRQAQAVHAIKTA